MKILSYEVANKWVYLAGLILVELFIFIFLSIPSCQKTPDTTVAIGQMKAELEKQYNEQLAAKEAQITDYKTRLTQSEGRYAGMVQKYVDLEKRKNAVAPPKTNSELRDRFTALGYAPLAIK